MGKQNPEPLYDKEEIREKREKKNQKRKEKRNKTKNFADEENKAYRRRKQKSKEDSQWDY